MKKQNLYALIFTAALAGLLVFYSRRNHERLGEATRKTPPENLPAAEPRPQVPSGTPGATPDSSQSRQPIALPPADGTTWSPSSYEVLKPSNPAVIGIQHGPVSLYAISTQLMAFPCETGGRERCLMFPNGQRVAINPALGARLPMKARGMMPSRPSQ